MKMRKALPFSEIVVTGAALLVAACNGKLAVVDQLDGANAESAASQSGHPPVDAGNASCTCGSSPALMPLSCGGFDGFGLGNGLLGTPDGSMAAFDACDVNNNCQVFLWTGGTSTHAVADDFELLGLSAFGDVLTNAYFTVKGDRFIDRNGASRALSIRTSPTSNTNFLSADGSSVLGQSPDSARTLERVDTRTGAATVLGELPDATVGSFSFNADGTVVAGYGGDPGSPSYVFRVTPADGLSVGLVGAPAGHELAPFAVSADGSVIAGFDVGNPDPVFLWTAPDQYTALAGTSNYGAPLLSADGSVLVAGLDPEGDSVTSAFRWTAATGRQEIVPGGATFPVAMSADGNVIVVNGLVDPQTLTEKGGNPPEDTFVWDDANGARLVEDVLRARGADLDGWEFGPASVLSADGKVLFGHGHCGGERAIYRAVLSD